MKYILIIITLFSFNLGFGQTEFSKEIDLNYNFTPHKLSKVEQAKVFPKLDSLFIKISKDTSKYFPLIRQELKSNNHNPYFYYDLSHFLLSQSKSRNDLILCSEALAKSDINDLSPKVYTSLLNDLAFKNIDISNAALNILEDTTFSFFVPEHAIKFSQEYCLIYCLLPLDNKFYVEKLINKFKITKSPNVQQTIITILWLSYSCQGDSFLKSLNISNCLSKKVLNYAESLLNNMTLKNDDISLAEKLSDSNLIETKNYALKRFTDEALHEILFVTKVFRKRKNCR